jgi:hypothetical protein
MRLFLLVITMLLGVISVAMPARASLDPRGLSLGQPICDHGVCFQSYNSAFHQEWGIAYTNHTAVRMQVTVDHCAFSWNGGAVWTSGGQPGGLDVVGPEKMSTMWLFNDQNLRPHGAGAPMWRCKITVSPADAVPPAKGGMRPPPPPDAAMSAIGRMDTQRQAQAAAADSYSSGSTGSDGSATSQGFSVPSSGSQKHDTSTVSCRRNVPC